MDPSAKVAVATLPSEAMPQVAARASRIHFVDLLRLIASTQMVHGHTIDALLAEQLRSGPGFERWSWCRGLVSVAFLFAAGISYHLSTLSRFDQHQGNRKKVIHRFRRALWLIVLGYLLHFPAGIFGGDAVRALHELAMVDVLQCIGLSVIALELMTLFATRARHVVIASAGLAVLAFALAPIGERLDPSGAWRPLVNYVTHQGGSLFPITPWAGYVFAGIVVGELVLPNGTRTAPELPFPRLALGAIAVLAIAGVLELVPLTLVDEHTSRNAEPAFNVLKLGVVLGIVAALALIGRRIARIPRVLTILAGESLILYVTHLFVLYGAGIGLYALIGHTLPLTPTLAIATVMVVFIGTLGLGWHRLKAWRAGRGAR